MNKDELKEKFEKNVEYLKRNIAPDDIYLFAEQTFMAALFFLHKWKGCIDVKEEMAKDPITKKWITNIMGLQICKDGEIDVNINLDLDSAEEE